MLEKAQKANKDKSLKEYFLINNELQSQIIASSVFDLSSMKPCQWFLKRFFDYFTAIFLVLSLFPLMLLTCIAIRLDSEGPVLFKQKRLGVNGKPFYMYKFRSMKQNSNELKEDLEHLNKIDNGMFKIKKDPRVTFVGRLIRKYSIDELPQLFNVIKGEMSLVGPRPPILNELYHYQDWHYLRFSTVPGITGLWQVSGRSKITNFHKVVKLDYDYISNWSLLKDFEILLKTVPVVLSTKGAC